MPKGVKETNNVSKEVDDSLNCIQHEVKQLLSAVDKSFPMLKHVDLPTDKNDTTANKDFYKSMNNVINTTLISEFPNLKIFPNGYSDILLVFDYVLKKDTKVTKDTKDEKNKRPLRRSKRIASKQQS